MKIFVLTLCLFIVAFSARAEDPSATPFSLTARDLQSACERNESMCTLWIEGVTEGMEFMYLFGYSDTERTVFCFDNFEEDMDGIRMDFMDFISQEENAVMLDEPAVLSLSVGLHKHLCRS